MITEAELREGERASWGTEDSGLQLLMSTLKKSFFFSLSWFNWSFVRTQNANREKKINKCKVADR